MQWCMHPFPTLRPTLTQNAAMHPFPTLRPTLTQNAAMPHRPPGAEKKPRGRPQKAFDDLKPATRRWRSVRRLRPSIYPRSQCIAPCACCCTGGHNKLGVAWGWQAVLPAMRDALWRLMSMQTARLHVVLCSEIICSPRTLTMDGEQTLVDWWCTHATFSAALRLHGSTYCPSALAVCVRPAVAAVCGCSQARSDTPTNITYSYVPEFVEP